MASFQPANLRPAVFRRADAAVAARDHRLLRGAGQTQARHRGDGAGWPTEFVDFVKREKLFATFLVTPAAYGGDDPAKRWDGAQPRTVGDPRLYGMAYWYTEQVTILGLGPIWQSANEKAKLRAAADLDDGQVMAFGLSERARRRRLSDRHDPDPRR